MPYLRHGLPVEICLLVLLSFLWGMSFALIEVAIESMPPSTIVLGRLAIGSALLLALAIWSGAVFPVSARQWGALTTQGILQSALPFTLISWGQIHIDSGIAGLLNTTPPLFVFLIGVAWAGVGKAALRQGIGVLVGFGGVCVIIGPAALSGDGGSMLGMLAVTGASLSYAVAALYAKRFSDQSPLVTAACSMTCATVIMVPMSMWMDHPLEIAPTASAVAAVVVMGVFSTALAMVLYFRLVRSLGPLGVTTGSYLRAGFSLLLGILLLGEVMSVSIVVGLAMIFAGVAIVTGLIAAS